MEITVGSDYSGVGAFDYAINRVAKEKGFSVKKSFVCDFDYYARLSYIANFGTTGDLELAKSKEHKYFADNVKRIALLDKDPNDTDKQILIDANEFAKRFSFYYPFNVYDREVPKKSVGVYMTSPPCQAFSNAGKRKGKEDVRGILFYNSLNFIRLNKPQAFIFENVEGLLSHDNGNTFNEWINLLGGLSVNGNPVLFPYPDSVPYHLYYQVVNTRKHGVPQNRPRIFLVGIRDDQDCPFIFPNEEVLMKSLGDCLEDSVDDKHFLSEKMLELITYQKKGSIEIANINKGGQKGGVADGEGAFISCLTASDYKQPKLIQVQVVKLTRTEEAKKERAKNLKESKKDTGKFSDRQYELRDQEYSDALLANPNPKKEGLISYEQRIRRLTPLECFRLKDFPDEHVFKCIDAGVSDTQLYKQAGNSITVRPLQKIISNLKFINK